MNRKTPRTRNPLPGRSHRRPRPPARPPPRLLAAERDAAIADFLDRFADCPDRDILGDLMVAITPPGPRPRRPRRAQDADDIVQGAALRFKVFAPYHGIRKVSIFGSSRHPAGHPDYIQAEAFARQMRLQKWMVITGAGDGIMGAGHAGLWAGRELRCRHPPPLRAEDQRGHPGRPKLVNFKYFFTRKILFLKQPRPSSSSRRFRHPRRGLEAADHGPDGQDQPHPHRHGRRAGRHLLAALADLHQSELLTTA